MKKSNLLYGTFHVHVRYKFDTSDDGEFYHMDVHEIEWLKNNCKGRVDVLWHIDDDFYRLDHFVLDGNLIRGGLSPNGNDDELLDFQDTMSGNDEMTLLYAFENRLSAIRFALEFPDIVAY